MAKADLHIHTTASDGMMSAADVVKEAAALNLDAIAVTDHDSIAGIITAKSEAKNHDLELIAGSEITTSFNERECHLLAYDFDEEDSNLNKLLNTHQKARVERAEWIINQLSRKGLQVSIGEVIAEANGRNVGRPHIAEILRKKGYIGSIREAFIRYLSDDKLGPIQSNYRNLPEVVSTVKKAGGVTVLAHPGRMYSQKELQQCVKSGIDGLEAIHRSHNYEIQKSMEEFAEKNNLLCTGGSDFHGSKKDYYQHFGTLTISMNWVRKIKRLSSRRKKLSI